MHWFLAQNTDRSALSPTFDTEIGLCGSHGTGKKPVDGKFGNLFGGLWLAGLQLCPSGWGFREATKGMLGSIACRCIEKDWAEDLGSNPKFCVLNSVYGNGLNGKCWKVQEKSYMRMLMMLRGGSAPLQIETGR